jgi:non-heme Fe2+,alpha-ketoglutarate-dependent halogenase
MSFQGVLMGHSSLNGLTESEHKVLYDSGYLGPYEGAFSEDLVSSAASKLLNHVKNKGCASPLYGRYSVRDWHLVYPELIDFVTAPSVLSKLQAIMGDDLILWRSHLFYKPPGGGPVGWHQEFGAFSGEDIGNNKPSLVPTHLPHIDEDVLREYLPSSLRLTAPETAPDLSNFWDITIWVALTDIKADRGMLRFFPGSHRRRYPVRMESLPESDFWQNPFDGMSDKAQLVKACNESKLVLDVDTSGVLDGVPVGESSFCALKQIVLARLAAIRGSRTDLTHIDETAAVNIPTAKGDYILFAERVLHGSLANTSESERLSINFRVTPSSTLVYPSRLRGDFIDGFNLDISKHENVLLSGHNLNPHNVTRLLTKRPNS